MSETGNHYPDIERLKSLSLNLATLSEFEAEYEHQMTHVANEMHLVRNIGKLATFTSIITEMHRVLREQIIWLQTKNTGGDS